MVVQHGKLFAPVALDYIKVLKAVVSFQAHMDYLDDATWIEIVQLAFNVVLGDSLRAKLGTSDQADAEDDDSEDAFLSPEDEAETSDDGGDDHARSLSKKRRRPAPTRSRASTPRPKQKVTHAASSEQVELISVLRIMLCARSAPLLSPKYPYLASAILKRLQRFLVVYPSETSLHQDYLLALSATLSHLSLNRRKDVETFTRDAWSSLVYLWGTGNKSPWKKEALVAVLRVLFPFLAADETLSSKWRDGVIKLWDFLHGEADLRTGIDGLSLDSLRLEIASSRGQFDGGDARGAFVAETFKAGWHFDAEQALAWAMLELQADCTKKVDLTCSQQLAPLNLSKSFSSSPRLSALGLQNPPDKR
jgi:serine-protein kinase ATM